MYIAAREVGTAHASTWTVSQCMQRAGKAVISRMLSIFHGD
jgi:hypothetical protein